MDIDLYRVGLINNVINNLIQLSLSSINWVCIQYFVLHFANAFKFPMYLHIYSMKNLCWSCHKVFSFKNEVQTWSKQMNTFP